MAGRIRAEDVAAVRERVKIDEVVGEHVTLRSAGIGSMKGLCPFHDEKSPSFHVRPQVGFWHCFGCNEGGDVISFVMRVDALPFAEAVEHLAGKAGIELRYEDGGGQRRDQVGQRTRLLQANRVASDYFMERLDGPDDAEVGRAFLRERGFDREAAAHFGVGYAPKGWDQMLKHLRGKGFTEAELNDAGLVSQGNRGVYDRFRGRLVWPIRDITGDVVGFGARKLHEDDQGPKYLNTSETPLYRKSQVLYGIDLAKKAVASGRQVVVVEGYTDVMACHLSGVTTAVATCGTAFGPDHVRVVRRLMRDDDAGQRGEVIFTFDGDEAGRKAALRAFEEDQSFVAHTFVAVESRGMDPCDLRQKEGDAAVRSLISGRVPMFEFAIRSVIGGFDLDTAEGRVEALRAAAPVVARIRDTELRPEYARRLSGWVGMEPEAAMQAVSRAVRTSGGQQGGDGRESRRPEPRRSEGRGAPAPVSAEPAPALGDPRDPVVTVERQVLECILQVPHLLDAADVDALDERAFSVPAHRALHDAIRAAGGVQAAATDPGTWVGRVQENAAGPVAPLVTRFAVAPLPEDRPDSLRWFASSMVIKLSELAVTREVADLRSRLQRTDPAADGEAYNAAFTALLAAEQRRRTLRERGAVG